MITNRVIKADCKKIYLKHRYGQPEGSVTVEAAVVIPVLLIFIYMIASFGLHAASLAKKYSETAELARKASVAAYLTEEKDAAMITFPGASSYSVNFFSVPLRKTTLFSASARPFTGRSLVGGDDINEGDDLMVFLAENASVYHKDNSCTHLKLSIKQAALSNIESLRNYDGGRYKPCEKCSKKGYKEIIYITNEGDRYHSDITCSGLKRTVRSVKESEAKDMGLGPCSRCGK